MKLLGHPLVAVLLALVLGIGVGAATFWAGARPLLAQASVRATSPHVEAPEKPWDFWTIEIDHLAAELRDARARLSEREEALAQRESRLAAEMVELRKLRAQIEALRDETSARVTEIRADEVRNLKTLAQTYGNLTPKAALPILRELDEATVAKILVLMPTETATALFQELGVAAANDPAAARRAASLTERLRLMRATRPAATP